MTEHAHRVQAQFGPSAADYVTSAGHAGGDDLEQIVGWGRQRNPARVLDVATGGGHTALAFAAIARQVVAFDLTEPMLAAACGFLRGRGATNVTFVAGDVEALPFANDRFPLVTCRIAAHHFANVGAAVRDMARVLTPGGALLVQDILGHDEPELAGFITEVERQRDPSHIRAYREAEWNAVLHGAGLTIIERAVARKMRPWKDWTRRMRMTAESLKALENFVRAAPEPWRAAFDFVLDGDRIESFTDRMLLLRADKD